MSRAGLRGLGRLLGRAPVELWVLPAAAAATYLLFGGVLAGGFIRDDFVWLECALEAQADLGWIFTLDVSNLPRPLSHLLNAAVFAGFGPSQVAFHVAAWVVHVLCCGLLARLALRLSGDRLVALASAGAFLLTPLYWEVTLWVSAINEALYALFVLGCLQAWLWFLCWRRRRAVAYGLALAAFVLGLGAKEAAVTAVPLMALVHLGLRWQGSARRVRRAFLAYLPFAVLLVVYVASQALFQRDNGLLTAGHYVLEPAAVVRAGGYLLELLGPVWAPLALGLASLLLVRPGRRELARDVRQGLLVLAGVVVAVVPYAPFTWGGLASRYSYLPSMGMALLAGLALARPLRLALARRQGRARGMAVRVAVPLLSLAAVVVFVMQNLGATRLPLERHLRVATRTRTFVRQALRLPPPPAGDEILILGCLLPGQHMASAMRVFHPSRSRDYTCVTGKELAAVRGQRWVWRWFPDREFFYELENTRRGRLFSGKYRRK
jgi:hypothetical protein